MTRTLNPSPDCNFPMNLAIPTLDDAWHDRDEILLHAAFQVLADFMEQERPGDHIDWNYDEDHRQAWQEINALYRWWKDERPARASPLDDPQLKHPPMRWKKIPGSQMRQLVPYSEKRYPGYTEALQTHSRLEKEWLDEDQQNLRRLIDIRPYLWT